LKAAWKRCVFKCDVYVMSACEISGLCFFLAKKKNGQTVRVKGGPIYLDDLNDDEPEIAELYLYSRHRNNTCVITT